MKKKLSALLIIVGLLGITTSALAQDTRRIVTEPVPMAMTANEYAYFLLDEGNSYREACSPQTGCHSVNAVEGGVLYKHEGEIIAVDAAVGIQAIEGNGKAYLNDGSGWERIWGYNFAKDIASNGGDYSETESSTWGIRDGNMVMHNLHVQDGSGILVFDNMEPPKESGGALLDAHRIDVDGNGMPWLLAGAEENPSVFTLVNDQWEERILKGLPSYPASQLSGFEDIAADDRGNVIVVADMAAVQFPQNNCIYIVDIVSGEASGGICNAHFTRVDVDANNVIWAVGAESEGEITELYKITEQEDGLVVEKLFEGVEVIEVGAQ